MTAFVSMPESQNCLNYIQQRTEKLQYFYVFFENITESLSAIGYTFSITSFYLLKFAIISTRHRNLLRYGDNDDVRRC